MTQLLICDAKQGNHTNMTALLCEACSTFQNHMYVSLMLTSHAAFQPKSCTSMHFFPQVWYTIHPSHYSWINHPNDSRWRTEIGSFWLCSYLHSPVTSSHRDPRIFLSTLFSSTINLCFSSSVVRDQISHHTNNS